MHSAHSDDWNDIEFTWKWIDDNSKFSISFSFIHIELQFMIYFWILNLWMFDNKYLIRISFKQI